MLNEQLDLLASVPGLEEKALRAGLYGLRAGRRVYGFRVFRVLRVLGIGFRVVRGFRVFPRTPRGVGFFFGFPNRVGPNGSAYVRRGKVSIQLRADSTGTGGGEAARDKGCGAACCKRFTVRGVTIRGAGLQQGHALARPANPGLQTEVPNPKPQTPNPSP